jgi:hypothetical protein
MKVVVAPKVGDQVRVVATRATGVVVEVSRQYLTADVDLGDGVTAELEWEELEPFDPEQESST